MRSWYSLLLILFVVLLFKGKKISETFITLADHERVWEACPMRNGSYKQCTNNGTFRHSDKEILENHKLFKNNPRVNIWRVEEPGKWSIPV